MKMKRDLVEECLPESDHFMAPAWIGLIYYAATNDQFVAQFEADTGMKFNFPGGIEGMIDDATGHREDLIFTFAHWVTKTLWGNSRSRRS